MKLGDLAATVIVCVIPDMNGARLSWHNSIALGLLHSSFPRQLTGASPTSDGLQSPANDEDDATHDSVTIRATTDHPATPATSRPGGTHQSIQPDRSVYPTWDDNDGDPTPSQRAEHLAMLQSAFPASSTRLDLCER